MHKFAFTYVCDPPSENQPGIISRNTILKYSVTKTRPQFGIGLVCSAAKHLASYLLTFKCDKIC